MRPRSQELSIPIYQHQDYFQKTKDPGKEGGHAAYGQLRGGPSWNMYSTNRIRSTMSGLPPLLS